MTDISEIENFDNYKRILDKGFVGLIDSMGTDADLANSARVSYGNGTKSVRQNTGLIRYLVKHDHTSPLEMGELKFHIKVPIFIARQIVRHRTASLNEISARYSEMVDDFYIPEIENIQPQSKVNNQGRNGNFDIELATKYQNTIKEVSDFSYKKYKELIEPINPETGELGLARELARMVLPVNLYTEFYFKIDLKNLLHFLRLRMDSHAQWEVQQYANAMYEMILPLFPETVKAFNDYKRNTTHITSDEKTLLKDILKEKNPGSFVDQATKFISENFDNEKIFLEQYNLSKREYTEFLETWKDM